MANGYRHVLVPLDGSLLAEGALGDAVAIAEAQGAAITLLQVLPPVNDVLEIGGDRLYVDEQIETRRARALEYLDRVRHRIAGRKVTVGVAVVTGSAADAILDYASSQAADLIVMGSHGRSGIRRWILGSVAEKVLHGAGGPVLLIRARDAARSSP
jgi:nucleotide-binding universal stress UspA family protein